MQGPKISMTLDPKAAHDLHVAERISVIGKSRVEDLHSITNILNVPT